MGLKNQPDCIVLSFVDDLQIDYYNSSSKEVELPEWAKQLAPADYVQRKSKAHSSECKRMKKQRTHVMELFQHSAGAVHMYQRKFGCKWASVSGYTEGLDEYRYDGKEFIVLKVKNDPPAYVHSLEKARAIAKALNDDKSQRDKQNHYFTNECPKWPKRIGSSGINVVEKPEVHLLRKNRSSPVVCLATGFYPKVLNMTWRKNSQRHHENMGEGETLPNGDGTFQKRISLKVETEDWKENRYHCLVQQKNNTYITYITKNEIKTNSYDSQELIYIIIVAATILAFVVACCLVRWVKSPKVQQEMKKDSSDHKPGFALSKSHFSQHVHRLITPRRYKNRTTAECQRLPTTKQDNSTGLRTMGLFQRSSFQPVL
ncbi:hypothetical protein AOLI_G00271850 [Acnodon oligacanthus]